jgi:hypothetical protein
MSIRFGLAAIVLCLVPLDSDAVTGNELQRSCSVVVERMAGRQVDEYYKAGHCIGYLEGFRSGASAERSAQLTVTRATPEPLYCVPDGVTNGQMAQVLMRYFQQHPADLHTDASFLLYFALMDAFPCQGAPK